MWELGFAEIDVTLALTAASMGFACWTGVSKREALPVLPLKILEELVQFHRHTYSWVSFSRAAVSLCYEDCMLVLLAKDALNKGTTIGNLIHMQTPSDSVATAALASSSSSVSSSSASALSAANQQVFCFSC